VQPVRILKNRLDQILLILFALSVAIIFWTNEDPFMREALCTHTGFLCFKATHAKVINKILHDIGIGSLISLIFYVLIVRLPDLQRRRRLRKSLAIHYKYFKEDYIGIFLAVADGSFDAEFPATLMDQKKFKDYFKQNVSDSQIR
jgi:hypothetical protein